jgi:hypothetical protein
MPPRERVGEPDTSRIWIEMVPEDEAEGMLAEIYESRRRRTGRLGNRFKTLSIWPELLAIREDLESETLFRGLISLRARRREMVVVLAAALIGCHF